MKCQELFKQREEKLYLSNLLRKPRLIKAAILSPAQ